MDDAQARCAYIVIPHTWPRLSYAWHQRTDSSSAKKPCQILRRPGPFHGSPGRKPLKLRQLPGLFFYVILRSLLLIAMMNNRGGGSCCYDSWAGFSGARSSTLITFLYSRPVSSMSSRKTFITTTDRFPFFVGTWIMSPGWIESSRSRFGMFQ